MALLSKQAQDKALKQALDAPATQVLEILMRDFSIRTQEFAIKLNALAQQRGEIIVALKQIETEVKSNKKLSPEANELLKKQSISEMLKLRDVEKNQQTLIRNYNLEQANTLSDVLRTHTQVNEVLRNEVEKAVFS